MAKSTKKPTDDKNLEAGLGDLAKLVLGKLDEHGVTMEQALAAITAAGKETPGKKTCCKKSPVKAEDPMSKAVITTVSGTKTSQGSIKLERSLVYQLPHGIGQ